METILELQDKSELITSDNHRILNYDTYISNMKRFGSKASKGLLFNGIPGTGKSSMSNIIRDTLSKFNDIHIHQVKRHTFMGSGVGSAAKKIDNIFNEFRNNKKKQSIILFEEIHQLFC